MAPSVAQVVSLLRARYGPMDDWWPTHRDVHAMNGTDWRFEVIVGAILTQNASWTNAQGALSNMLAAGACSPREVARLAPAAIQGLIRQAGTYRQKARTLLAVAHFIEDAGGLDRALHSGASSRQRWLDLAGIGPETADAILCYAADQDRFVVDAYARRTGNRLGWPQANASYDEYAAHWNRGLSATGVNAKQAHALVVEHAKNTCTVRRPQCGDCPLERHCAYPRRPSSKPPRV